MKFRDAVATIAVLTAATTAPAKVKKIVGDKVSHIQSVDKEELARAEAEEAKAEEGVKAALADYDAALDENATLRGVNGDYGDNKKEQPKPKGTAKEKTPEEDKKAQLTQELDAIKNEINYVNRVLSREEQNPKLDMSDQQLLNLAKKVKNGELQVSQFKSLTENDSGGYTLTFTLENDDINGTKFTFDKNGTIMSIGDQNSLYSITDFFRPEIRLLGDIKITQLKAEFRKSELETEEHKIKEELDTCNK